MQKIYSRINWENFPSEKTAVNESNLNKMDLAIDNLDDRVVAMDASKVDLTKANELVEAILLDESNGTLTVVKMNGSRAVIDTKLEKLAVNFTYNPQTQQLVIALDDGTVQNVDLSSLITEYEFLDSDTIAFEIVDGKVKAIVKNGSITENHLAPEYLAEIRTQVGRAEMSAKSADASEKNAASSSALAKSYAVGGTGTREGEDTDNAKYYAEQAKNASDVGALSEIVEKHISNKTIHMTESEHGVVSKLGESAEGSLTYNGSEIKPSVATAESTGVVKPDGTTITIDEDGTLHGSSTYTLPIASTDTLGGIKPDGKTTFVNEEGVLSAKGGGATITPKPTVNPQIKNDDKKVVITWEDPTDTVIEGSTFSTWAGTKLVMKESGYPENENDGTVLIDNTEKDKYKTAGYEVTGLTNGNTYYFALFPYSTDGIYNYQASNRLLGKPSLVRLDPCTDMSIASAMGSATVKWTDPEATKTVDGNTATWAKTVLVYKQGSTAPSSVSDGIVAVEETTRNQYSVDGFTVDGLTDGKQYSFALFAVSTEGVSSDATIATANLWATLIITTGETKLYEKEVTATYGSSTVSGTFSSIGSVTLQIPWIGETTITSTDGTDTATSVVTISAYESTYSVDLSFLKIVTFAGGTDAEIAKMIQAHYNDKINIADYWAVGDTRSVSLSAMSATGVGESHRAQTVQFVIGDFEHDDLATAINGHTKAAITLLQKDCLMDATSASNVNNGSADTEKGYMNSTNTNVGGWKSCARRTWCNNVYFSALPSTWQSMVKIVNKKSGTGGRSSSGTETTQDKIFLAAEIEIFGSTTYSFAGEGTQYQYYKNATANRYKMPKLDSSSASNRYWERSPGSGNTNYFCGMNYNGYADYTNANNAYGVAPCLCI